MNKYYIENNKIIDSNKLFDIHNELLKLVAQGINTLPKMEKYYEKFKNSQITQKAERANLCKECIPIMKNIPGVENLYGG